MADFTVTAGTGTSVEPWDDPASVSPDRPSRINPRPEHIHKRWVASVGVECRFTARIGGAIVGDVGLGGLLFTAVFLEAPQLPFPPITSIPTLSAIKRFTPPVVGHYTLQISRANHGSVIVHVDVDS